jgi:GTPase SAR1 family protein
LVGNKIDLEDERAVTTEEGKELAQTFNCAFIEASAKTNTNVSDIFFELVSLINKWKESNPKAKGEKKKKGGCLVL